MGFRWALYTTSRLGSRSRSLSPQDGQLSPPPRRCAGTNSPVNRPVNRRVNHPETIPKPSRFRRRRRRRPRPREGLPFTKEPPQILSPFEREFFLQPARGVRQRRRSQAPSLTGLMCTATHRLYTQAALNKSNAKWGLAEAVKREGPRRRRSRPRAYASARENKTLGFQLPWSTPTSARLPLLRAL